jgi:hypothetical protein
VRSQEVANGFLVSDPAEQMDWIQHPLVFARCVLARFVALTTIYRYEFTELVAGIQDASIAEVRRREAHPAEVDSKQQPPEQANGDANVRLASQR